MSRLDLTPILDAAARAALMTADGLKLEDLTPVERVSLKTGMLGVVQAVVDEVLGQIRTEVSVEQAQVSSASGRWAAYERVLKILAP